MPISRSMPRGKVISELMSSHSAKGSIGKSGKISRKKAKEMAVAIAYSMKRKRKRKGMMA